VILHDGRPVDGCLLGGLGDHLDVVLGLKERQMPLRISGWSSAGRIR